MDLYRLTTEQYSAFASNKLVAKNWNQWISLECACTRMLWSNIRIRIRIWLTSHIGSEWQIFNYSHENKKPRRRYKLAIPLKKKNTVSIALDRFAFDEYFWIVKKIQIYSFRNNVHGFGWDCYVCIQNITWKIWALVWWAAKST